MFLIQTQHNTFECAETEKETEMCIFHFGEEKNSFSQFVGLDYDRCVFDIYVKASEEESKKKFSGNELVSISQLVPCLIQFGDFGYFDFKLSS